MLTIQMLKASKVVDTQARERDDLAHAMRKAEQMLRSSQYSDCDGYRIVDECRRIVGQHRDREL